MRLKENATCKQIPRHLTTALTIDRRTYGKDIGEDIREGYEPPEEAVEDSEDHESGQFVIGDDVDGAADSEETREWQRAKEPEVLLKPKYGLDGEDVNPWSGGEPSESPKENP